MIAIVTVLFAFPLGYFLRNRASAYLAYAVLYLYSFTFQSVYLLRAWVGDSDQAFPKDPADLPIGYLVVTASICAVGFGIVTLAHRLAGRRRVRRAAGVPAVDLDAR